MIIVSITGPTMHDALRQIAASSVYADLFELRLDLIADGSPLPLVRAARKKVIVTCRPEWEGGAFSGTEQERLQLLMHAVAVGADFVDIELKAFERFRRALEGTSCHFIVSLHRRSVHRAEVRKLFRALHGTGAEVIKLACGGRDAGDTVIARDFLALCRRERRKGIAIAMGEGGEASRVLYRRFGGWATYASPELGSPAAAGQLTGRELKLVFRAHKLNRSTRVFGVIGHPLSHSRGIYVHNPLFRGLNAVYCRFPVSDLPRFMREVSPILQGFSVTLPHKRAILRYLQVTDAASRAIGAVNTVIRRRGRLVGSNSDAPAAIDAIEKVRPVRGKTLLVLGAGGAARAIAFEAKRRGADVVIANRTFAHGRQLARAFGVRAIRWSQIPDTRCEIIANATPVGMSPRMEETPLPSGLLRGKVVFDAIYNPPVTRLLREARRVGATVVSGVEMFLNQAAAQSRLYTGHAPDRGLMKRLMRQQQRRAE